MVSPPITIIRVMKVTVTTEVPRLHTVVDCFRAGSVAGISLV